MQGNGNLKLSKIANLCTQLVDHWHIFFHCPKVCWFEPYTIFSGGMPRASYGDRHCISVICGDSTQATFDFTSRVVDFFIIFHKNDKSMYFKLSQCQTEMIFELNSVCNSVLVNVLTIVFSEISR